MSRSRDEPVELLQGTLDMLILQAVSLGSLPGYGVLRRLDQLSRGALQVPQGSLYPALYRLERQGLLTFEWGESENRRRSKLYTLTPRGRARLTRASERWSRQLAAVGAVMAALPEET
jgi:transcriptional regulator